MLASKIVGREALNVGFRGSGSNGTEGVAVSLRTGGTRDLIDCLV